MDATHDNNPVTIVELAGAHQPRDRGLTSLGLLMQLVATAGIVIMLGVALLPLTGHTLAPLQNQLSCTPEATVEGCTCHVATAAHGDDGPRNGSDSPILILVALTCVMRSLFHRAAGSALVHESDRGPRRHLLMYIIIAAIHTPVMLVFLQTFGASMTTIVTTGTLLVAWPLTLWTVARSQPLVRAMGVRDAGFAGVGVLLTALGLIATIAVVFGLTSLLHHLDAATIPPAFLLAAVTLALLARSVVHALAGWRLATGASLIRTPGPLQGHWGQSRQVSGAERSVEGALINATIAIRTYRRWSAAATALVGITLIGYGIITWTASMTVGVACLMLWLMWSWPRTLGRFSDERAFAANMASDERSLVDTIGDEPATPPLADGGLVSMGWLMLAVGVLGLAYAAPAIALGSRPWALAAVAALQTWAGLELINMTGRHQQAARVAGACTIGLVLFVLWPQANAVLDLSDAEHVTVSATEAIALAARHVFVCCVHLGVAIAAILFANRADTSALAPMQLKRIR